jgi:hypothetical protein
MAINNFIPEIWSNELLVNLRKSLVAGQAGVINRDYEGTIRNVGDTVHINSIGEVTIDDYVKNTDMDGPETLTDATRALEITEAKYFNFQVDDIDRVQQTPKVMAGAMAEAAYGLADVADQFILGLYEDADAGNVMSETSPAADDAYEVLVDLGTLLSESNIPKTGRWAIVPPWFHGLLLKDDRFVGAGTSSDVLINGLIGRAAGMTILESNNCPSGGSGDAGLFYIVSGHPMAWSYAEQISSVEGYRPQARFADAVKGLHLYGAKVVRPTALAVAPVNRPAS